MNPQNIYIAFALLLIMGLAGTGITSHTIATPEVAQEIKETITVSPTECTEKWICGDWDECVDGKKSRACMDINHCGTAEFKPSRETVCAGNDEQFSPKKSDVKFSAFMILLFLFLIIALYGKMPKDPLVEELERAIVRSGKL